jgi:hypothetical protein
LANPVAWKVVLGNQSGSWRPYWEHLFHLVAQAVPSDWFVLVLADRGLYSRWLFQLIRQKEWHPFLRINGQGFFCPQGESYRPLWSLAPHPGTYWWGVGTCFKTYPLHCTLLAVWGEESQEPWFTPQSGRRRLVWPTPRTGGLRAWVEGGFKDFKRGGWQ